MALAHDLGRENGEDHRVKVVLHLGPLLLGQLVIGQVHNALLGQQTADPVIELALDLYEAGNGLIDRLQLFPGRMPLLLSTSSGETAAMSTRLPTRSMKNSSRLLAKMAINFSRSRAGTVSSAPSSRTRRVEPEPAELPVLGIGIIGYDALRIFWHR